jgi:hypothetical protein
MRELGIAGWLESLGALDRAEAVAKQVLAEAKRLSREWMQRFMVDLLAVVAARRGPAGAELAAWVGRTSDEIGFHPTALPQAEAALSRGDFAQALALADQTARGVGWPLQSANPRVVTRRTQILASSGVALRALAALGRWEELLARSDAALAEAEATGFRTLAWRILATRARARDARGDAAGAREDRSAARALLDDMAARIADPELRAAFESDALVSEVTNT